MQPQLQPDRILDQLIQACSVFVIAVSLFSCGRRGLRSAECSLCTFGNEISGAYRHSVSAVLLTCVSSLKASAPIVGFPACTNCCEPFKETSLPPNVFSQSRRLACHPSLGLATLIHLKACSPIFKPKSLFHICTTIYIYM